MSAYCSKRTCRLSAVNVRLVPIADTQVANRYDPVSGPYCFDLVSTAASSLSHVPTPIGESFVDGAFRFARRHPVNVLRESSKPRTSDNVQALRLSSRVPSFVVRRFPTVGSTAISWAMFRPCSWLRPFRGCLPKTALATQDEMHPR
jgi:hypothetical protein